MDKTRVIIGSFDVSYLDMYATDAQDQAREKFSYLDQLPGAKWCATNGIKVQVATFHSHQDSQIKYVMHTQLTGIQLTEYALRFNIIP